MRSADVTSSQFTEARRGSNTYRLSVFPEQLIKMCLQLSR